MRDENRALLHVYTGNGKGKTTAAFGLAMRAAGRGLSVLIIQFLKHGDELGEVVSARRLPGVRVEQFGTGSFVRGCEITETDRRLTRDGIARAEEAVSSAEADLIILDELNVAVHFGLVSTEEVLSIIDDRPPSVEIVITGRNAPSEIIDRADYVTELVEKKHPYRRGIEARPGIEL